MPEIPALEMTIAILGALSTAIGAATSSDFFVKLVVRLLKSKFGDQVLLLSPEDRAAAPAIASEISAAGQERPNVDKATRHLRSRLERVNTFRKRSLIQASVYAWSARLLIFSQYIVGGVLTLSFVKQNFTPQILGVFGVIVFVASGLSQRFNPAANAEVSSQRAERAESLINDTEDEMVDLETTNDFSGDDPRAILDLTKKVSSGFAKIKSISKSRKRTGGS